MYCRDSLSDMSRSEGPVLSITGDIAGVRGRYGAKALLTGALSEIFRSNSRGAREPTDVFADSFEGVSIIESKASARLLRPLVGLVDFGPTFASFLGVDAHNGLKSIFSDRCDITDTLEELVKFLEWVKGPYQQYKSKCDHMCSNDHRGVRV